MSRVDVNHIQTVEFGVCLSKSQEDAWVIVPVDTTVQEVIKEMVCSTAEQLRCFVQEADLPTYEPAEKYASMEALRYPIEHDDKDTTPIKLFNAQNLPTEQNGLNDPSEIFFYFAICRDQQNKKLLAIRRAAQFKAVLKAKGRLIRWLDDTMSAVEDDIFKLDQDFDYLVTEDEIYILRPSGFEFTADLDELVLAKATQNTQKLQQIMEFVDFNSLAEYVSMHKRAARLVAAIRSRDDLSGITVDSLKAVCKATGVEVEEIDDKVGPVSGHEMHFLMLLDRRRYSLALIEENTETYEAASRRKV